MKDISVARKKKTNATEVNFYFTNARVTTLSNKISLLEQLLLKAKHRKKLKTKDING